MSVRFHLISVTPLESPCPNFVCSPAMASTTSHNKKSSAVKRILSEARELASDRSQLYTAAPLEDDIFEWHFTLRGPQSTEFEGGLYHGRILLPSEYPMRPPNLILLTPNGRWELGKKICLTFTGFHEEMWQPAWGVRTALLGLQTFMTAKAEAAVGIAALNYPPAVRQKLAVESRTWTCPTCAVSNIDLLPDVDTEHAKQESLPPGLSVDLAPPSSTNSVPPISTLTEQEVVAQSLTDSLLHPPPDASAQVLPTPPAPSIPPPSVVPLETRQHQASNPLTPPLSHSDTEQKLYLIDRCIALVALLIALLIYSRFV